MGLDGSVIPGMVGNDNRLPPDAVPVNHQGNTPNSNFLGSFNIPTNQQPALPLPSLNAKPDETKRRSPQEKKPAAPKKKRAPPSSAAKKSKGKEAAAKGGTQKAKGSAQKAKKAKK